MEFRLIAALFSLFLLGQSLLGESVHRVQEGESLWLIARKYGVSVESLRVANRLDTDVIWEGATLQIPAREIPPLRELPPREVQPSAPQERPIVERRERALPTLPPPRRIAVNPPSNLGTPSRTAPVGPLSEKGLQILQLQITLDRAGFSPGKIDGYDGRFTQLAKTLCEAWNPSALRENLTATRRVVVHSSWRDYVNVSLPGHGAAPDFKALTRHKQVLLYYSALEYLAERYHCSEGLLQKLNPGVDFKNLQAGTPLIVPNVEAFQIEDYFNRKGEGVWSDLVGKGKAGRRLYISAQDSMLTLWEGETLIRAYPITLNLEDSPRGQREIGTITPGPYYARKKTKLELKPGPNSPVGIVWCPLGNGFGIHGTSNPDSIGRSVSSGCVRLANWDAVRFAGMIRKGTQVFISQRNQPER